MGLETLSSKKKNLTAEFISHTFGETRFFAKNRVGSEGVTGLKPRGRPPRLDDTIIITLQLKKLGNLDCYLDIFHLIGVFIRRGLEPNSVAVGTA